MPEHTEGKHPEIMNMETCKKPVDFEFKDSADVEEYLMWKETVPLVVRRLVESAIKGVPPAPSNSGLPLTDQFLNTLADCFAQKQLIDTKNINTRVTKFVQSLDKVKTKGGYIYGIMK